MTRQLSRRATAMLLGAVLVTTGGREALSADTYDVNVVFPLTGRTSFLGQAEQKALQILEKVVNNTGGVHGRDLRFIFHDDQSSPQTAVQLTAQILAAKPVVMIGSAQVAMCNAMGPLVKNGPVTYCTSPGIHPKEGEYLFTSSVSTYDLAAAVIRYFRLKKWTKIALITSTDASGQDAERGIKEVLARPENKDVQLVENAHFNPSDISVSAQIERIKSLNPDALIAWTTGAPVATVFKAVAQAALDIPVATTNGNMTYEQMTQYASFLPTDLFIPSAPWPEHGRNLSLGEAVEKAQKRFFDAYREANIRPDTASSLAWDPGMITIDAVRSLPPNASAADVRAHIAKLKGYGGINGTYDFTKSPQRGLDVSSAVVTRWDPKKEVWQIVSEPTGTPF